jgi:ferritin
MTSITTRISVAISAILLLNSMMLTSAFTTRMTFRVSTTTTLRALSSTDTSQRISTKLEELWNEQVHKELFASQFYLSASIWCKNEEFEGMSSYMRKESDEERGHAMGFIDFALKKNIPLQLKEVDAPPNSWDSVEELWEDMLKLEQTNTQSLFELNDEANSCHDPALITFLQPYHMEQTESEDALQAKLAKVRDESKTPGLIRQLDEELGNDEGF